MSYDIYRYIFLISAGLAVLCLILSVILFFVLKIPRVIGDLTGSTAKKAIESIRNQNEKSGDKVHKTSYVNKQRGRITDKMTDSGKLIPTASVNEGGAMATAKISTTVLATQARESYEASLLEGNTEETTILDSSSGNETTVLSQNTGNETTVLSQGFYNPNTADETSILSQNEANVFVIEYELTFIHTDEVII
ncbi:MAG: hypothetical protein IJ171_05275 [Ruminococcus sp.]|nr:hypothetical protein [Ruminococcus sp.]